MEKETMKYTQKMEEVQIEELTDAARRGTDRRGDVEDVDRIQFLGNLLLNGNEQRRSHGRRKEDEEKWTIH